ncbi:YkuS family protein [Pseudalkalibacillus caeni]|uniref:UPF0180 protein FCL54_07765 n=1 Tax=Exobacillus caeni TaxID=2574798 RepID=A0A5R9FA23_9BACL|nr:YkuS family protein [Pseudalkalibacillus caeni]TLS37713.1 YkuS family protein [Pseudalkalibacillus caeni]
MPRIGVEESLSDVVQALQDKGYDVVALRQEQDANGCDCCVITGQDQDIMGISDVATKGPVISAQGMTADEICQQVESRLK